MKTQTLRQRLQTLRTELASVLSSDRLAPASKHIRARGLREEISNVEGELHELGVSSLRLHMVSEAFRRTTARAVAEVVS